nr:AraC family transcriptional regulator [Vibrio lentus]
MENKKRSKEKAEYKLTEELGGLEILNAEYE